jgi:flavin reductase (DIM6/NTAB) family NADH-FMN oxidoreductase RutF
LQTYESAQISQSESHQKIQFFKSSKLHQHWPQVSARQPNTGLQQRRGIGQHPRITDCKINFACTIAKEVAIDDASQILVFARITKIWVADEAIEKDYKDRIVINPEVIDPLLRLGAGKYGSLGSVIPTPTVN